MHRFRRPRSPRSHPSRDNLSLLSLNILLHPVESRDYFHFQLLLILARGEDIEHFIPELKGRNCGRWSINMSGSEDDDVARKIPSSPLPSMAKND
jgi:hypothetical protein